MIKKKDNNLGNKNIYLKKISVFIGSNVNYFIGYFVFFVIFSGYSYLLHPQYVKVIKNNQEKNKSIREEINDLSDYEMILERYVESYNQVDPKNIKKVNSILPFKNDTEELFVYIRNIVENEGMTLLSLDMGLSSEENKALDDKKIKIKNEKNIKKDIDKISDINIILSMNGVNYNNLKSFLNTIENDMRFFNVDNIEFSLTEGVAKMEIKTYYKELL